MVYINLVRLSKLAAAEQLSVIHHVRRRDEEILPAIIVQIIGAGAPAAERDGQHRQPAGVGRIGEYTSAEVLVQSERLVGERSNKEVGFAVVVDIPEIHSHTR